MNNENIKNIPYIFTIFGVTGDLATKKIIPSLWHLFQRGRLPKRLSVIGFSRREFSDKEFIENFRFSNNLFENAWDNTMIERIDIRLLESIGVEDRGSFYDSIGTLRDVGQNHILTMLAAITMEYPTVMNMSEIRKNRATILETLKPWTEETLQNNTY